MLLAYDGTGTVIYMLGAISLYPDGPPDALLPPMFAAAGVSPAGVLRINDKAQASLVAQVLAYGATVVGGVAVPNPPPSQPSAGPPQPREEETMTGVVKTVDPLTVTLPGYGDQPAQRHGGYTPMAGDKVQVTYSGGHWIIADKIM